jgi:hypothetical protein
MTQYDRENEAKNQLPPDGAGLVDVRLIFRVTPEFELYDVIDFQSWVFARAKRSGGMLSELTPSAMTRCCHFSLPSENLRLFEMEVLTYAKVTGCFHDLRRHEDQAITIEVGKTAWKTSHS